MNPRLLGIDENFLNSEMPQSQTEQLMEHIEAYEDVIERQDVEWQ